MPPGVFVTGLRAELLGVEGEAAGDGVEDGGAVLAPSFFDPELVEHVPLALGGGHDADLELALERIGDGRIEGAPDGTAVFVNGELVEDEVGTITPGGVGIGGEGDDAGAVSEADLGGLHERLGGVPLFQESHGEAESFDPLLGLLHPFEGLAFSGG